MVTTPLRLRRLLAAVDISRPDGPREALRLVEDLYHSGDLGDLGEPARPGRRPPVARRAPRLDPPSADGGPARRAQRLSWWRMTTAGRILRSDDDAPLQSVAERVGYRSEVAFNRALKREFGVSPGAYRRRGAASRDRRSEDRSA
ncbi:helix-turn-helix domain-containing protein [Streptomyces sp. NPDC088337]